MMKTFALLLTAAVFAAEPAVLKEIDDLYLHRNESNKLETSIDKLKEKLKADPKDASLQWRLGRSLVAKAEKQQEKDDKRATIKQAKECLKKAVDLAPNDSMAHYWRARQLGIEADLEYDKELAYKMRAELEKAIDLDPKNAAAHQSFGDYLREMWAIFGGDTKQAVKECEQAVSLSTNSTGCYLSLAESYLEVDKKDEAKATLKKVSEIKKTEAVDPADYEADLKKARELLAKLDD